MFLWDELQAHLSSNSIRVVGKFIHNLFSSWLAIVFLCVFLFLLHYFLEPQFAPNWMWYQIYPVYIKFNTRMEVLILDQTNKLISQILIKLYSNLDFRLTHISWITCLHAWEVYTVFCFSFELIKLSLQ